MAHWDGEYLSDMANLQTTNKGRPLGLASSIFTILKDDNGNLTSSFQLMMPWLDNHKES